MTNDTARHVRKYIFDTKDTMYQIDLAFERGDRDLLLRLAKQLVVTAGHLANAIARYYFPTRTKPDVDRSWGFFPPSAPPR
jgi:hypothetical protein